MTEAAHRHLLSLDDLDDAALDGLLRRAAHFADARERQAGGATALAGATVANLFFEPSTRTRASFELAARRLGADVLNLDIARSSTAKGESLTDTVRTLHAMRVGTFVVRHSDDGVLRALAEDTLGLPLAIVNAGEGRTEHPTQALIDTLALERRFGRCAGLRVAIIGDIAHSRVARSAIAALTRRGAEVRIAGPAALLPASPPAGAAMCASLDEALEGVHAVMALRIQRERIAAGGAPDEAAYHAEWGLSDARLVRAKPDAVVLHPGPFNRGVELASELADGPRALILTQVALGVPVRMLEWATGR